MKQVAMESVNGGGTNTGKFGRGAPKDSGLGSVGVDDVWLEDADFPDELGESSEIIPRFDGSPKAFDTDGMDIGGLAVEVVSLVVGTVAGVEAMLKFVAWELSHESRDLNRWTANIHAGDDAHDAETSHGLQCATRR